MATTTISIPWAGWELGKTLGGGSFGKVYEIRRTLPGGITESAAMKVISVPSDPGEARELLAMGYSAESISQRYRNDLEDIAREYSLMSTLKGNANIVYCDDLQYRRKADGIGWDLYIKMELLIPLNNVLVKPYSEDQTIRLGLDLCSALTACRKRNIIHRDIKPANIMVSSDGRFKLGDFGVAKTAERTAGGTKTGTYNYMAPEVFNNKPYGTAADLYSVGMVLYWMLNRQCGPFLPLPPTVPTASQMEDAKIRRFRGDPLPAPAYGSAALKKIVLKACAYDPQQRYASSQELSDALSSLLHGRPDNDGTTVVEEQPVSGAYRSAPYRSTPKQEPFKAMPPKQEPVKPTPPKQEPVKTVPPKQEPPKAAAQPRTDLDVHKTLVVSSREAKFGCKHIVTLDNGHKVSVTIPAGARSLRLAGLGKQDPVTKQTGTLYLNITTNKENRKNAVQSGKPAAKKASAPYPRWKGLLHLCTLAVMVWLMYLIWHEYDPVEGPVVAIVAGFFLLLYEIMRMQKHPAIAAFLLFAEMIMIEVGLEDYALDDSFAVFTIIMAALCWSTCPTSLPQLNEKVRKPLMVTTNVVSWVLWLYQTYDFYLDFVNPGEGIAFALITLALIAFSQYMRYKNHPWIAAAALICSHILLPNRVDDFYRQIPDTIICLGTPLLFWFSCPVDTHKK